MFLESFGEQTQVDLSKAKWEKWTEKGARGSECALLEDLFCGAGGASKRRVCIARAMMLLASILRRSQIDPFTFHQANALLEYSLGGYDLIIVASPPCQPFTPLARREDLSGYQGFNCNQFVVDWKQADSVRNREKLFLKRPFAPTVFYAVQMFNHARLLISHQRHI